MSIKGFSVGGNVERYDYNSLDNLPSEITIDTALSDSSTNPVQNRVVTSAINSANDSISSISGEVDDLKSAVSGLPKVFDLPETSSVSRQFQYDFHAGCAYTITNNTSVQISFQTRETKTGATVQDVGSIFAGASVTFDCTTDTHWFNSWCPQIGNISISEKNIQLLNVEKSINSEIIGIREDVYIKQDFSSWTKGTANANGTISTSNNGAVSSIEKLYKTTNIYAKSGCRCFVSFFDQNKNYIGKVSADGSINKTAGDWKEFSGNIHLIEYAPSNAKYFRICLVPTDGTTITDSNVTTLANQYATCLYANSKEIETRLTWDGSQYFRGLFLTHRTHDGAGNYKTQSNRNAIVSPVKFACDIVVSVASGFQFAYQTFDGHETGQSHMLYASPWITGSTAIPANTYWCMIVAKTDGTDTDDTTQNALTFAVYANATDIYERILLGESEEELSSFVVGADSIKRPAKTVRQGVLTYHQSFCVYDGKYYSTDGENVGVQDASFAPISSKALSVGHGNAFQLGHNGKAYVSGWNDQKIYVVDMESLTVESIITLPTTGYTTAVVDDLNHIAYVFQRDSHPDTVANYNFIVYDYQAQQIKSTRIVNAFSAMQSADLQNGRIAVLWGLGTTTAPSGMAIYNTTGDILAEFLLDIFASTEPEGICFDRKTGELQISMIDKAVYKIS